MEHITRLIRTKEVTLLQQFIREHWRNDHVFTRNRILLEWQHLSTVDPDSLNFIAAFNKRTNEIDAIRGYISPNHFDNTIQHTDIWFAIWKNRDDCNNKSLGLAIYFALIKMLKPRSIGSIGMTDKAREIYKKLGYNVGVLDHFYISNEKKQHFTIAKLEAHQQNPPQEKKYSFTNWDQQEFPLTLSIPTKSTRYLINRYIKHPIYKYKIKSIRLNGKCHALFVYRKIHVGTASCLRIVDWQGAFSTENIASHFQAILEKENSEYIDLLCFTPEQDKITLMGFKEKGFSEIIPEYFEPFIKKNIHISYAYKSKTSYTIFKGDSDQDRPSIEPEQCHSEEKQ